GADLEARSASGFDFGNGGVDLVPVGPPYLLQMIDCGRRSGAARYFDQFVDTLQQSIALRTHVTDIAAAALGSFGRQRNELIGFGEGCWRVDERGSDTERALFHGL